MGLLGWIVRARKLTVYEDLDKRYVKKEDFNRDLQGFRGTIQDGMADVVKRAEAASAQAGLAVQNADTALAKAAEVAQVVERVHERELKKLADLLDAQDAKMDSLVGQMIKLNTQFEERFPRRKTGDRDDSR